MKKLVTLLFIVVTTGSFAQKGKTFPQIKGITLEDKPVSLPVKNGKYSVVAIAYHRDAEDVLKTWLKPLYETFIQKEDGKSDFDMTEHYDVNFIFVPMISGFKMLADKFRKGTEKELWQYIMDTEKTDVKGLQKELEVDDNKIPYFYVLDKDGKILASEKGSFNNAKLDKLEEVIE
jgi:hypothetical protein